MKRITLTLMFVFSLMASFAQKSETEGWNVDEKTRLALAGYDPVAYIKDKKAAKGKSVISADHDGVRYQFTSQNNKDLFLKSPASYTPQYGGWCAYAMGATGEKVDVDPETFKIIDGKLYLFYNRFFNNTLDSWNKNEAGLKADADRNWAKQTKR